MDRVVLGVDGEEVYVVLAGGGEDEVAGGYETFFVGEADGFAGEDGGVSGFEAGYSDDGRDYEVDGGEGGYADCAGCAVDYFYAGDAGGGEAGGELVGEGFGGDGDDLWAPAAALLEDDVEVGAGGERDGVEAVGVGLADA